MKQITAYCLLAITCSYILGCASARVNRFRSNESVTPRIPVSVEIDSVVSQANYCHTWLKMEISPGELPRIQRGLLGPTIRYRAALDLLRREFEDNIADASSEKRGFAVCRIIKRETSPGDLGYFFFGSSLLTLFAINLVGYPACSQTSEIGIEVEILDSGRNPVAKYTTSEKGTAYCAMFWGYSMSGALNAAGDFPVPKAADLLALRRAIDTVKKQIQRDASSITGKLVD